MRWYAIRTNLVSDAFTSLILGDVTTKNENMGAALALIQRL